MASRMEAILELLRDKSVTKITLTGDSGVGKTWTAKLVSEDAMKEGLFELALWVFLTGTYNKAVVRESIARQLSLLPLADEWDAGDDVTEAEKVEKNKNLQEMIGKSVAGKQLLLILDYRGKNKMDVEQETLELESPLIEEEASTKECYNLNQLLHNGYDLLLPRSIIIDCCRQRSHFFLGQGKSIHYNELLAYWILEGYLGHIDCLEKVYEIGHSIFIELVDCQVLRKLEGGFVTAGSGTNHLEELDRYRFGGKASLGLADLFTDGDWQGFGGLIYTDGMVKSICKGIKELQLSTLFLNGSRCCEILDQFYMSKQELKLELQVLALFNPTFESLPQLLYESHKLVVLVLRGCDFLVKIVRKFDFERLTVLEISNV